MQDERTCVERESTILFPAKLVHPARLHACAGFSPRRCDVLADVRERGGEDASVLLIENM